jgi:hypothetical protein
MHPRDLNHARRVAEWYLRAGWVTAAAMLIARLTTVMLQLHRGRLDPANFGQALFKSGVLIAVVLLYRRHVWPAYLLLAVWPFGFVGACVLTRPPLSVMAIGLLVGVGFALGARGAYTLRQLRALDEASPAAV